MHTAVTTRLDAAKRLLPKGIPLTPEAWQRRHRAIITLLWCHVVGIPIVALATGNPLLHGLAEAAPVAALGLVGSIPSVQDRRLRAISVALGLLTASAVLVHLSHGLVEMHFHFFVMIGVITLYQEWSTYAAGLAFVVMHHGVVGVMFPHDVFNHQAAYNNPWKWAVAHGVFVLGASAAQIVSWRFVEDEYQRAETQIRQRERRFRALIENSADGITVVGPDGSIVYDSPAAAGLLGMADGDRVGRHALDNVHPDELAHTEQLLADMVTGKLTGTIELDVRVRHHDGSWRHLEAQATNLLDDPEIGGIVCNFRDVTRRKKLEDRLTHQAFHDSLTGLPNRALFADRVNHALVAQFRTKGRLALLYLDVDDFKTINDALGHGAGDDALKIVANRLTGCLRASDTAARLGGDEFAVLLEGIDQPGDAYEVGGRILEALADPIELHGNVLSLGASLGIVLSGNDDDAESMLRNADLAMYQAKQGGKGRYEIFERGMHDAVMERLATKADLRRGLEAGEFVPYYQPIVDLDTGRITAVEALVRWMHPERGRLAPGAFIDLAEETGIIVAIGETVLEQACRAAASWTTDADGAPAVSVNLSARQIQQPGLVDTVARVLADTGLAASRLTLEITESVLLDDPDAAADTLAGLKALGVSLALDDFGTGYSSLSYLGRFPVDSLKIDKSFVDALGAMTPSESVSLVGAIAGIGDLLHLAVTAEGIERPAQIEELTALGCRSGQGYLFSVPVEESALAELFTRTFDVAGVPDELPLTSEA